MQWKPDKNKPLCPQICEQICLKIALGEYEPSSRLPSVRETALAIGVNPNTVQNSFQTLETQGVIYSVRGSGWYVCEDIKEALLTLEDMRRKKTEEYLLGMCNLGLDINQVKKYIEEWQKNE